jgi:hypothetical protein
MAADAHADDKLLLCVGLRSPYAVEMSHRRWWSFLVALLLFPAARARAEVAAAPPPLRLSSSTVRLADAADGAALLGRRDSFVAALSPFDRAARLKSDRPVDEAAFLRFVAAQAQPFSDGERQRLTSLVRALDQKLVRLDRTLPLPPEILILKTSGREEGQAAYCRGNAIILPTRILAQKELETTLPHELFHLISRTDAGLRRKLYALVGFRPGDDVPLPESLRARKITNPDAYRNDYRIRVHVDGKSVDAVPVLYASTDRYDAQKGGALVDPARIEDYATQLGGNTDYIIHPEEVLAECFRLVVDPPAKVASPELLARVKETLPRARP